MQREAGERAELGEVGWTEIGKLMLLPVRPDKLDGVELRRVRRQPLQDDLPIEIGDELLEDGTAVRSKAVPDDEKLAGNLAAKLKQEVDHLGRTDRARVETE